MTGPATSATVGLPGESTLAVATFVGLAVATALALAVAARAIRGYRASGGRGLLFLAAGIVLLGAVPIVLRLVLVNATTASPATRSLATTGVELLGLAAILYAVYGLPPTSRRRTVRVTVDRPAGERADSDDADGDDVRRIGLAAPLQVVPAGGPTVVFLAELVTAAAGSFVAYQAYRGYRRNGSRPMRSLGAGVLLLTGVPFAVSHSLAAVGGSDAAVLFATTLLDVLGLASVLHALTRA